jgi:hypothetical protein
MLAHSTSILRYLWSFGPYPINSLIKLERLSSGKEQHHPIKPYLCFFQREKEEALNEMDAIRDRLEITQVSISRNFFFFVTGGETIS